MSAILRHKYVTTKNRTSVLAVVETFYPLQEWHRWPTQTAELSCLIICARLATRLFPT